MRKITFALLMLLFSSSIIIHVSPSLEAGFITITTTPSFTTTPSNTTITTITNTSTTTITTSNTTTNLSYSSSTSFTTTSTTSTQKIMYSTTTVNQELALIETYNSTEYTLTIVIETPILTESFTKQNAVLVLSQGATEIHHTLSEVLTYGTITNSNTIYITHELTAFIPEGSEGHLTFVSGTFGVLAIVTLTRTVNIANYDTSKNGISFKVNYNSTTIIIGSIASTYTQLSPTRYTQSTLVTRYTFSIDAPTKFVSSTGTGWLYVNDTSYYSTTVKSEVFQIDNGVALGSIFSRIDATVYVTTTYHYVIGSSTSSQKIDHSYAFLNGLPVDMQIYLGRTIYLLYITAKFMILFAIILAGVAIAVATDKKKWLRIAGLILLAAMVIQFGPSIIDFINNW